MPGRACMWCLIAASAVLALLVVAPAALAFDETGYTDGSMCGFCHPNDGRGHPAAPGQYGYWPQGPHGGYTNRTERCQICHTLHAAAEDSVKLLPASTIVGTCFTCHDGTGGQGVYGTILARTGSEPAGGHRISVTDVIPGGDPVTGGDVTRVFREDDTGYLICTDCHSPHGSDLVEAFLGERFRSENFSQYTSQRLLRRQPTGASEPAETYGSDWCLACHEGRDQGGMVINHPVDSTATAPEGEDPFNYNSLPVLDLEMLPWEYPWSFEPTTQTVLAPIYAYEHNPYDEFHAQVSLGYVMPYPRSPLQEGRGPICQQCHEDARFAGTLFPDGTAVPGVGEVWYGEADGLPNDPGTSSANPRFQNFPHETENARMLVEIEDDLCMNCHPMNQLP